LQLVFSWQRQRYYFSTSLPDSPINRKLAEQKARQIELDFVSGNFDPSFDKYRPEVEQPESKHRTAPNPKLLDLWEQYMEYRTPNISPTTLNSTYEPVAAHIRKCKTDGLKNPLKFWTELLKATTESQARRSLMQISAACDWGLKHNLIQENPFSGMYLDMLQSKAPPPVAFTVEERDGQRPAQRAIASLRPSSTTADQALTTGTMHPSSNSCSGQGAAPVRPLGCAGAV
jgi:hypothetical protein